jgi:hypothetical protein
LKKHSKNNSVEFRKWHSSTPHGAAFDSRKNLGQRVPMISQQLVPIIKFVVIASSYLLNSIKDETIRKEDEVGVGLRDLKGRAG